MRPSPGKLQPQLQFVNLHSQHFKPHFASKLCIGASACVAQKPPLCMLSNDGGP